MLSLYPQLVRFTEKLEVSLSDNNIGQRCIYYRLAKGRKVASFNRLAHGLARRSCRITNSGQGNLVYSRLNENIPCLLYLPLGTQMPRLLKG
jgi:hypothetical protein